MLQCLHAGFRLKPKRPAKVVVETRLMVSAVEIKARAPAKGGVTTSRSHQTTGYRGRLIGLETRRSSPPF